MASLSDSRTAECPRLDSAGVSWPRLPLRAAVRLDWARVRRFGVAGRVASWEDDAGRLHARPVEDREQQRALLHAWEQQLTDRLARDGALRCRRARGQEGPAPLMVMAAGLALLGLGLAVAGLLRHGTQADVAVRAVGAGVLCFALAALLLALAWCYRELGAFRELRLDREGLHVRDAARSWRLVLSSRRESAIGPRHWRRDLPWLSHGGPLHGLGDVPLLILVGWARRAGRKEPVVPAWDAGRHLLGIGRRLLLLWAPLSAAGLLGLQRLAGFPEPNPWLAGGVVMFGTAALGGMFWWLGHLCRDQWEDTGRRADELLARLGW